jgi:hypothetical protein
LGGFSGATLGSSPMKKGLVLTFWAVGSTFAVLWTVFWLFALIYTRKISEGALLMVGIGVFCAWEGFKTFQQERKLDRSR